MLWEQFRSLALPLLAEHFPPELIEDNGDSIVFTDRRSLASFFVTENARGLTIGRHEERNTVGTFFTSPSIELATIALTFLAREGLGKLVDMHYPTDELLGPVSGTDYSITEDRSSGFHLTHKTDSTLRAKCDYFTYARALAEASTPSLESLQP
ncbi:hypothetical protein [Schaalia odontolytica]|uniref:Uncharacterized protein n=1 Tax=Schaalia odontolytica TaxID=1660 RepID=A0A2X0U330_9ACTO|nr:hypothetical protein [Schaalia odontolytica]WMS26930.1 hypothetical protein RDV55_07525 [Schaalia odontolytica]SPT55576.1 Uncharacterised protein [Schaalia odontolytica]